MKQLLFLVLLCCILPLHAQTNAPLDNRIVVNGEGHLNIPADQVIFSIQLQSTDSSSISNVYEKHKAIEKKIVKLLKDLKIQDKNISYSLFSIGRTHDYQAKTWYYLGHQTVTFKLDSIALYSNVQKRLIMEGFGEFGSSFGLKNPETYESQALTQAVENARKKANVLATVSNRKIKRILTITDTYAPVPLYGNPGSMRMMKAPSNDGGNLTEFAQTIPVDAQINVVFELE